MKWITAKQLDDWAGTEASRSALSELVSALVRGTVKDPARFRFPTGDSAQLPGYDGRLEANGPGPYIPEGTSVWEFGTTDPPIKKATKDYRKRTQNPGSVDPARSTFVFVTPRPWPTCDRWVSPRLAEGAWLDIRVIDGSDLEAWLEQTPAVAERLARQLGFAPQQGAMGVETFWAYYSGLTVPALTESVLTAGREKEADELLEILRAGVPQSVVIRGDSPEEALAFAVAAMGRSDEELGKFISARTLVVDDTDVARLLSYRGGLIFFLRSAVKAVSTALVQEGNYVIVPIGNSRPDLKVTFLLRRPPRKVFAEALSTMGLEPAMAERLTLQSGRSVTFLQHLIPGVVPERPPWLESEPGRKALVTALLAGAWDNNVEHDRLVLGQLSRQPYHEFERNLQPLLTADSPPVMRIGSVWTLVAPAVSYQLLAHDIIQDDLDLYRSAALTVWGELEPALTLPPEERELASLRGIGLRYSRWLRAGLAGTLQLLADRGREAQVFSGGSAQEFVDRLLADLTSSAVDYRFIASLGELLVLLIEAAPDPLVASLERMLEGDGHAMAGIFSESPGFGPSSPHPNLLWALELLAWDPSYLGQAVTNLARLARIDPGGNLTNRPLNSLSQIFFPWYPSTNASSATRLRAMDRLLVEEPEIGWELLLGLVGGPPEVFMIGHRPAWREAGASERQPESPIEDTREYIDRLLASVGGKIDRWLAVTKVFRSFPIEYQEKTCDLLEGYLAEGHSQADRNLLWSDLREVVELNKKYATANWAFKAHIISRLSALLEDLTPRDLVAQSAWLFDSHVPDLPDTQQTFEAADSLRREALRPILAAEGVAGILRLAEAVRLPELVGLAATELITEMETMDHVLEEALKKPEKLEPLAIALSAGALRRFDQQWRDHFRRYAQNNLWAPESIASALLGWPDSPATWTEAAAFGAEVESLYWRRKRGAPLFGTGEEIAFAVGKYLEVGRAAHALDAIARRVAELPPSLVFSLLDAALGEAKHAPSAFRGTHWLDEIFQALSGRADISPIEVARREYAWLPLLEYRHRTLTLHRLLSEEPEFFVEVLCDVFKARSAKRQDVSEEEQARATTGYRLLQSWTRMPGLRDDKSVDAFVLRAWVRAARKRAAEVDRATIGDQQIGRVLAYAPPDPQDGAWPILAVRELIEDACSSDLEKGIDIGLFNKRGAFRKILYEGGAQEREIAVGVREWAKLLGAWPRTRKLLERVADSWDRQATREDQEAEKEKLRDRA